ncbi:hypothetical protein PENTCL1PPCAC_21000, partial [Pristionchus entomophagus]
FAAVADLLTDAFFTTFVDVLLLVARHFLAILCRISTHIMEKPPTTMMNMNMTSTPQGKRKSRGPIVVPEK